MKKKYKKTIALLLATIVATSALMLTGCSESKTKSKKKNKKHSHKVEETQERKRVNKIDFSQEAQRYMEYIGINFPNRMIGEEDHDNAKKWIANELINAGYDETQISYQRIANYGGENVVLKVDGSNPDDDRIIVVGGHYDGDGVGDNGSGTALVLATACGLQGVDLPLTTYFVFFDCEEIGLYGSQEFVERMDPSDYEKVVYMIDIDAIAFGDYCNLYGGDMAGSAVVRTEAYDYAMSVAEKLGFNTYGTRFLDGYYKKNGTAPELDSKGFFTNPWSYNNPPPTQLSWLNEYYSPATLPASDHVAFAQQGIRYICFEASNWYVEMETNPYYSYTGYTDVGDTSLGESGMIMNTPFDTLEYLDEHFPGRSLEHYELYSPLLTTLIMEPMD